MKLYPSPSPRSARKGSLLIVALIFTAAIALSLGSFLNLANQTSTLSYRTFHAGTAMNAAETGLEQAMWAAKKRMAGNTTVWADNGWTITGAGEARQTFALPALSGGATAEVKVYVNRASLVGSNPFIIARGIVRPKRGAPIERWIRVTLSQRSLFSRGLVAKDTIRFNGNNASVDSYDSRRGAYTPSPSVTNRFDRGTAGSASVSVNTLNLGNADIWGGAVVGTSNTSGLSVGPNGTVGPFGTTQGTVVQANVLTNFTANFEDVAHPPTYSGTGAYTINSIGNTGATTLPRPGDVPNASGKYFYNISSISLGGNAANRLNITGNVVIRMVPTTGTVLSLAGNASINIASTGASLELFTQADVDISGNGVAFTGSPANFMLWGTRPQSNATPQSLTINGNGVLSAVVYAPNANISMHGGGTSGNVYGSMTGKNITVTGNSAFHYDEALADLGGGAPLGMSDWTEYVTFADRQANATYMNF